MQTEGKWSLRKIAAKQKAILATNGMIQPIMNELIKMNINYRTALQAKIQGVINTVPHDGFKFMKKD